MKVYEDLLRFEISEDLWKFIKAFEVSSIDILKFWVTFISKMVILRIARKNWIVLDATTIFVHLLENFLKALFAKKIDFSKETMKK